MRFAIYTRHDGNGGFLERPRCLMLSSRESVVSSLRWYRGERGYTDAFAMHCPDQCKRCGGVGTVALKRPKFARKVCPDCKGIEAPEVYISLDEIEALPTGDVTEGI